MDNAHAPPAAPAATEDREAQGIFGPLRIGPVVGVSFPRPVSLEVLGKIGRDFGVGIEWSMLPTITIDPVSVRASAIAGDLRWFVLGSPFFLGAGVGVQSLSGDGSIDGYSAHADATKVFLTPRMGVFWTFEPGFSIGADAGIELPLAHHETVVPALDQVTSDERFILLTQRPLPEVHLARLGWLF